MDLWKRCICCKKEQANYMFRYGKSKVRLTCDNPECIEFIKNQFIQVEISFEFGEICSICRGRGKIPFYSHIDNGICYRCKGRGYWYS